MVLGVSKKDDGAVNRLGCLSCWCQPLPQRPDGVGQDAGFDLTQFAGNRLKKFAPAWRAD
jgi:hypothetical protein